MKKRTAPAEKRKSPARELAASKTAGQGRLVKFVWPAIAAGFGALLVLSFFAPADSISVFLGTALPQNFGWLMLAVVAAFASRKSPMHARVSRWEMMTICGGLIWLLVASWIASSRGDGRAVWNGFWQIASIASCFYIGRALLQFAQVRKALVMLLIVACSALSIQGLEQVAISMPQNRAAYLKDPERMLVEQGIDAPAGSPRRKQFEDRLNSPEPFATFALANSLATLLSLGVMLSAGVLLEAVVAVRGAPDVHNITVNREQETYKSQRKWIGIAALAIVLALQLICLLLTRSRTAYLALMIAMAIWFALEWSRWTVLFSRRALQLSGGALIVVGLAAFGWLLSVDRLVWSEASKSFGYRLEYWQATLAMIRDHLWTGVGLGNFQAYYPQYKLERASEIIADPHNWMLDIAATLSVPTLLLVLGWLSVTLTKSLALCMAESRSELGSAELSSRESAGLARGDQLGDRERRMQGGLLLGLIVGAIGGGFVEASFLSLLGMLDFQVTAVAWIIAAVLGWLAWHCGAKEAGARNLLAGVLAMLCCLLAAGAWQASGIALPLLVILAILSSDNSARNSGRSNESAATGTAATWIGPALALSALAIFVLQTWRPVTQSWIYAEQASTARSADEQLRLMEAAVAADPLDAEREVQFIQLIAARTNAIQDASMFSEAVRGLLQRLADFAPTDGVGYLRPKLAGQIAFDLGARAAELGMPNGELLAASGGFYNTAIERYPSSVELLIQRAVVAAIAGDWPTTSAELQKAEEISDRTPHADKQIGSQLIWMPLVPEGYPSQTGYVPAEPLFTWLRTQSKAKLGELDSNSLRETATPFAEPQGVPP